MLKRVYLPKISFYGVALFNFLLILTALILEIQAILIDDLFASLCLHTILFFALFLEYRRRTTLSSTRAVATAPVYELEKLHRYAELGRMSSGFIHDLTNPLTAVSINLEDLQHELPSPKVSRALAGAQTMQLYVKAARSQLSGDRTVHRFKIRHIIDNIEQMTAYKSRQSNVSLKIDCPVDLLLTGSPVRLQQALSNLTCNAIDAYRDFDGDDRVVMIRVRKKAGVIVFEVTDRGSGIAPENLSRIFEPFYTTKLLHHGTGIGLVITKDIIEKEFGGTITLDSDSSEGTVARIVIPAKSQQKRVEKS